MVVITRRQVKRRKLDMEVDPMAESTSQPREQDHCGGIPENDTDSDPGHSPPELKKMIDPKLIVMNAADGPTHSHSAGPDLGPASRTIRPIHKLTVKTRQGHAQKPHHNCYRQDSHEMLIHIKPVGESAQRRSAHSIGHDYFRFRCPLGDVWHDVFTDACRHRSVRTGDQWIDRAVRSLPFQGFDMAHIVGTGRFSFVLAAYCPQKYNGMVVIKMLTSDRNLITRRPNSTNSTDSTSVAPWHVEFPNEVRIHKELSHPNVVTWLDYMTYMNRKCIILEFCHLGDIEELMQANPGGFFTEGVALRYFRQMVDAVHYIHSQNVVHRDIHCKNWVLDRNNIVKLIDFGAAEQLKPGEMLPLSDSPPGRLSHLIPEALLGQAYEPRRADIWALGVVLYKMVSSRLPFGTEPRFKEGAMQTIPIPDPNILPLSSDLCHLLTGILHPYNILRYSLNRIIQSSWVKSESEKFYASNFFRVRHPVKVKEGDLEKRWKRTLHLNRVPSRHSAWNSRRNKHTAKKDKPVIKIELDNDVLDHMIHVLSSDEATGSIVGSSSDEPSASTSSESTATNRPAASTTPPPEEEVLEQLLGQSTSSPGPATSPEQSPAPSPTQSAAPAAELPEQEEVYHDISQDEYDMELD